MDGINTRLGVDQDFEYYNVPLFENMVAKNPTKVALTSRRGILDYHSLNAKANQLAWHLTTLGIGLEIVVGVYLERGIDHIVSLLAIWKAGGVYLPIDISTPRSQLDFTMADSNMQMLISCETIAEKSGLRGHSMLLLLDDLKLMDMLQQYPLNNLPWKLTGQNLAYIIYTSGTSGKPKGVTITHSSLTNMSKEFRVSREIEASDRVLLCSAFCFDASIRDLHGALLCGATLHIPDAEDVLPGNLTDTMRTLQITYAVVTPSVLRRCDPSSLPHLRTIVVAGEASDHRLIRRWGAGRTLINAYGPTEATVCSSKRTYVDGHIRSDEPVSIGTPTLNTLMYVLRQAGQRAGLGDAGEIYIGGPGVSQRGYQNRAELNAQAFPANPFGPGRLFRTGDLGKVLRGGEIEFLGRKDSQLKVNGVRIEAAEIENLLRSDPGVQDAVIAVRGSHLCRSIAAYVIPTDASESPLHRDLRSRLEALVRCRLSRNKMPNTLSFLDSWPLNASNKIVLAALPDPLTYSLAVPTTAANEPLSVSERIVARALRSTLGLPSDLVVRASTTYAELGGNSLMAQLFLHNVNDHFKSNIQIRDFYSHEQSIRSLAKLATRREQPCYKDFGKTLVDKVRLPFDILPARGDGKALNQNFSGHVLLTGAAGYLGAHVLAEILSDGITRVTCIVRASGSAAAKQRIINALQSWNIWSPEFSDRIDALAGDISASFLGLCLKDYEDLARRVGRIWHCAAAVNFISPYDCLEGTNVKGSIEIMRFACALTNKYLVFISTLATFFGTGDRMDCGNEVSTEAYGQGVVTGYAQTKWVAEQMVLEYQQRGGKVLIIRPGRILGSLRSGLCPTMDLTVCFLKSIVETGVAPDLDWHIDFTPVDICAQVAADLAKQTHVGMFHVLNPRSIALRDVVEWLGKSGYTVTSLPYKVWKEGISHSENLRPLLSLFQTPVDAAGRSAFDVLLDTPCFRQSCYGTQRTVECLSDKKLWEFPDYADLLGVYTGSMLPIRTLGS